MRAVCQPLLALRDAAGQGAQGCPPLAALGLAGCILTLTPQEVCLSVCLFRAAQQLGQQCQRPRWARLPASPCQGRGQHEAAHSDPACLRNFPMALRYPCNFTISLASSRAGLSGGEDKEQKGAVWAGHKMHPGGVTGSVFSFLHATGLCVSCSVLGGLQGGVPAWVLWHRAEGGSRHARNQPAFISCPLKNSLCPVGWSATPLLAGNLSLASS